GSDVCSSDVERAGGWKVGYSVATTACVVLEHIVGHGHKCIFLAERRSIFTNEGQPVDIGIDDDAEIILALLNFAADIRKVFRERLRVVWEMSGGFAVDFCHRNAKFLQQHGHDNATS